ncbi:MAG: prepilin-type N-terminal cleavage/methylation domain-containing protein [Nitrospirae bacterium]|nr:prepilin-type N-terminal cleavage/methylation domain-containing protein [Nitrospirota bacterium]
MLRNKEGFTLIELVMVIVILGILAAIAIPKYADLAQEARTAVLDASAGAVKSAAVIQFAKNRTTSALASVVAQTDLDAAVSITGTCASATATHSGGGSKAFSISTSFCSP